MHNTHKIKHIVIDFDDDKITSNGVEISIDHKAIEVLKLLVENSGDTVSNNAFMDHIWADKPSAPEVIPSAIARLRKLFKQAGISDDLIVTVHKVGYRYEPIEESPNSDAVQQSTATARNPMYRNLLFSLVLLGLLVSLGLNFKYFKNSGEINQALKGSDLSALKPAVRHPESISGATQIYILRHTEKADEDAENPELSAAGIKRAKYWKKVLQHIDFDQVFTTDFIRNIQTAELISDETSINPELYYPMSFDVLKFINLIKGKKVLIIGHSNTIPDMVNRLIDETRYPPMDHQNYNVLYLVTINKNGDSSSSMLHIENPIE